ncbi:PAS domain S-box protein [Aquamicrobium sp. LC103]|uniref:sensor histidine kinase n=1 Tax=Aquamicrobium sp. LC103 TaxID=1120658 RepID=UPI00063E9D28|nr:PAS domain S-box protein [Aquamicrobium sp. LC103]TKT69722.1 PAS domain S-box protein [Aquamicrobium sp. LC103]
MSGSDSEIQGWKARHADYQLAAIVQSSFDAIISKDLGSIITSWNPAAERLFGYSAEEAIGKSILMLIPQSNQGEEKEIIDRIRRGEWIESYETVRVRKDGTSVLVSITVSPIRDQSGRIIGASKIARDITATKESERRIRMLLREVNHRVKNQYAVILSIISQTRKRSRDPLDFEAQVRERIMALARSHDLLVSSNWSGAALSDLVRQQLKPFRRDRSIDASGPPLMLTPNAVQYLGMAFHELGTNSAKHGAMKGHEGRISVTWEVERALEPSLFRLSWQETDGGIQAGESGKGFGTFVLLRIAPQSLGGEAQVERTNGVLTWTLTAPLDAISDG